MYLSSILEDILPVINGRRLEIIYQQASIEKLSQASEKLLQWFKALPAELQWNQDALRNPSPGICALHMHFLSTTILLHRPFAAYLVKSFEKKNTSDGSFRNRCLRGQTPEVSQKLCTTSGIRISKILSTYRLHHGANKFFSTINPACLSAAMALMSDIISADPREDKSEEKKWLAALLQTLEEITPTYPVAGRSYVVLCAIVKACGLTGVVPSSSSMNLQTTFNQNYPQPEEQFQNLEALQLGPNEMVWGMNESLGWEFYPMFDEMHDIGPMDFYPRLSPWPSGGADDGN